MPRYRFLLPGSLFVAAWLALSALAPAPAAAQNLAALVNGEPITGLDVTERQRLHRATGKPNFSRKEALEELIEQKLKLQVAQRAGINPTDDEIDRSFASVASRSGRTAAQFTQALAQGGINADRFKQRIKADLAWQQYVKQNGGNVMVRDADIVAVMQARGQSVNTRSIQYTMQQVIFVTRRNAPADVRIAKVKAAEALRARVQSCEQAVSLAREYPEVVVKPKVRRLSTDLSANLQKLLAATPDGRMTPPEPTANGIEVVAICERKEIAADISANRDLKNELFAKRIENFEKRTLDDMRKKSIIRVYE